MLGVRKARRGRCCWLMAAGVRPAAAQDAAAPSSASSSPTAPRSPASASGCGWTTGSCSRCRSRPTPPRSCSWSRWPPGGSTGRSTERYAVTARAVHYASTRAEDDYAQFSEPGRGGADRHRPRARSEAPAGDGRGRPQGDGRWPDEHYGYRAADVQQMLTLSTRSSASCAPRPGRTRSSWASSHVHAAAAGRDAAAAADHGRARRAAPGGLDAGRAGRARHAAAAAGAVHRPRGGACCPRPGRRASAPRALGHPGRRNGPPTPPTASWPPPSLAAGRPPRPGRRRARHRAGAGGRR